MWNDTAFNQFQGGENTMAKNPCGTAVVFSPAPLKNIGKGPEVTVLPCTYKTKEVINVLRWFLREFHLVQRGGGNTTAQKHWKRS